MSETFERPTMQDKREALEREIIDGLDSLTNAQLEGIVTIVRSRVNGVKSEGLDG